MGWLVTCAFCAKYLGCKLVQSSTVPDGNLEAVDIVITSYVQITFTLSLKPSRRRTSCQGTNSHFLCVWWELYLQHLQVKVNAI